MKSIIGIISSLILCVSINAATWTIHGAKDNWLGVSAEAGHFVCSQYPYSAIGINGDDKPEWMELGYWDFGNDQAFPEYAYSGLTVYTNHCPGDYTTTTLTSGWSEIIVFAGDFRDVRYSISGGYPDYVYTEQFGFLPLDGEYWIDFDSSGTARISTSAPSDFGKWAWDGSVNPNYAEPIIPSKIKGRKHRK